MSTTKPATVVQAIDWVLAGLSVKDRERLAAADEAGLAEFYREMGLAIRNGLDLWTPGNPIIAELPPEHRWPDDATAYLLERARAKLRAAST